MTDRELAEAANVLAYHLEKYLHSSVDECGQHMVSLKLALVEFRLGQASLRKTGDE